MIGRGQQRHRVIHLQTIGILLEGHYDQILFAEVEEKDVEHGQIEWQSRLIGGRFV